MLFQNPIAVRGRTAKVACEARRVRAPPLRQAEVAVRGIRVTLRPPRRPDRQLPPVAVNVVLVSEINPPSGDEPVEWLLVTSLPIDDVPQVPLIIQYYTVGWMIEALFRVLKSGCRVEERLFEHLDRLLNCLAVYSIVAWRTLYVCRLGRSRPELNCEAIFEPAEWKSVWKVVLRKIRRRNRPHSTCSFGWWPNWAATSIESERTPGTTNSLAWTAPHARHRQLLAPLRTSRAAEP